ncbi:MAG: DUF4157 domain-containing protein [Candidatus Hydrothermarchaeaceae archaeon]
MKNKSIFFVIFIVSLSSIAVVFAGKNYNSSKSCCPCCYGIVKLRGEGVSEKDIERITDAFDSEVKAYARYNDMRESVIRNMRAVGMNDDEVDEIMSKIWTDYNIHDPGMSFRSGDPLKGLNTTKRFGADGDYGREGKKLLGHELTHVIQQQEIRRTVGDIGINEEGTQGIETALNDGIRAADDYGFARLNTIAAFKEAGITDDAKIAETLDELYEPVRSADTIYDTIDQAMVDFPFLAKIFGNEKMNVYVGEMAPFNVVTQNGGIESLNPGEIGNPTMKVYTNTGTINQLIAGEITPTDALMEGKIRYEGVGLVNKIKFKVLNVVSGLLRKFGFGVDGVAGSHDFSKNE